MYLTPAHRLLLRSPRPVAKLMDVQSSVSDLTTYTFNSVNIGDLGMTRQIVQTLGADQVIKSQSNKQIVIIVHSEDAAVTWTVSSCTIGGVAGSKIIDRGGGTAAVNTAIFVWPSQGLDAIANTNVVVTFSEAVTACAIGVLSVENAQMVRTANTSTGINVSGAGGAVHAASGSIPVGFANSHFLVIVGSTCATGGGTENAQFQNRPTDGDGCQQPLLLYQGSNAEIDYAAAAIWQPGYCYYDNSLAYPGGYELYWGSAGAFDSVMIAIL